ncbi:type 1 glutamine amidotransferase domain-containing protein [Pelagicoccus mobilis]|uniref:Type 1 glutamine amidotransferase domain-containing protein n=1 Tax=Pelagicoccus mobilis TaxID=415221 RepID=A0A934VRA8_9BACT|nr:type 1 glutamine amidotransferase domain-containing protein [Pelagicoccus mobilis]MBK1877433.1 type 1 glutamine amidotransferase domain-containing protein [Pelagicoccus mobilis]
MKKRITFASVFLVVALSTYLVLPVEAGPKVLLVVTNQSKIGDSSKATGSWLSEITHAWTRLDDAGYTIHFASPKGGHAPIDPGSFSLRDKENRRFWETLSAVESLATTLPLAEVDPSEYVAIYFAGGHGTMWDFPKSEALANVAASIYESGGSVAAVCHGPAALVNLRLSNGELLIKGKRVAGFTNAEERIAGLAGDVPFLLEDKLEECGAIVEKAGMFNDKVVVSGRLITGQNPASAARVAEALIESIRQL